MAESLRPPGLSTLHALNLTTSRGDPDAERARATMGSGGGVRLSPFDVLCVNGSSICRTSQMSVITWGDLPQSAASLRRRTCVFIDRSVLAAAFAAMKDFFKGIQAHYSIRGREGKKTPRRTFNTVVITGAYSDL